MGVRQVFSGPIANAILENEKDALDSFHYQLDVYQGYKGPSRPKPCFRTTRRHAKTLSLWRMPIERISHHATWSTMGSLTRHWFGF